GLAERDTQVQPRLASPFRINSMSEQVVWVALLALHERGRFQLHNPLELYFPVFNALKGFAGVDQNGGMILEEPRRKPTIRDAFRHTVGVGAGGGPEPVAKLYTERRIWVNSMDSLKQQMELLGTVPQTGRASCRERVE